MKVHQPLVAIAMSLLATRAGAAGHGGGDVYLPSDGTSQLLTVEKEAPASAGVIVLTEALAIKETGPKATVRRFGETYAFSPAAFAVQRDQPTLITFRNLQPDDVHDFMLTDPDGAVLMKTQLPALRDTSYVFTFHREGIFPFYCTIHQPAMSGQIIVLPTK
jgi:plastocyanin